MATYQGHLILHGVLWYTAALLPSFLPSFPVSAQTTEIFGLTLVQAIRITNFAKESQTVDSLLRVFQQLRLLKMSCVGCCGKWWTLLPNLYLALLLVGAVPAAPVVALVVLERLVPNVCFPPFLLAFNAALIRSNL